MKDIHCHILPGVDDGSASREESIRMLKAARAAGITQIVATPHLLSPDQDTGLIREAAEAFFPLAAREGMPMTLGYEVNYKVLARTAPEAMRRYCFAGTDILLLEFSTQRIFPGWQYVLSDLSRYYRLIVAHPERYAYLWKDMDMVDELRGLGCEMQLDAEALSALAVTPSRRFAHKLLKSGRVQHVASDAHSARDYAGVGKAAALLARSHNGGSN